MFKEQTKTNKQLFITLVTSYGLQHNEYSLGLVTHQLTINELFVNYPKEA